MDIATKLLKKYGGQAPCDASHVEGAWTHTINENTFHYSYTTCIAIESKGKLWINPKTYAECGPQTPQQHRYLLSQPNAIKVAMSDFIGLFKEATTGR